jgi:hypothetical protein
MKKVIVTAIVVAGLAEGAFALADSPARATTLGRDRRHAAAAVVASPFRASRERGPS